MGMANPVYDPGLSGSMTSGSMAGSHPVIMSRPQVSIERLPARRMSNEPRESMNCKSCRKRKVRTSTPGSILQKTNRFIDRSSAIASGRRARRANCFSARAYTVETPVEASELPILPLLIVPRCRPQEEGAQDGCSRGPVEEGGWPRSTLEEGAGRRRYALV